MKLILVRHGAYTPGATDSESTLSKDGIKEVKRLLKNLKGSGFSFSKVLTSPKTRAVQTATILAEGKELTLSSLLDGSHDPMLIYHEIQPQNEDILLVTHNPYIGNLSRLMGVEMFFPTAGCIVLEDEKLIWKFIP